MRSDAYSHCFRLILPIAELIVLTACLVGLHLPTGNDLLDRWDIGRYRRFDHALSREQLAELMRPFVDAAAFGEALDRLVNGVRAICYEG